ncbi:hypothetical protein GF351_01300 [Candidatus Woesearchaeota archaeon]|nr:hypothetical protein [Candidatus Woesearchaeota archaeon]
MLNMPYSAGRRVLTYSTKDVAIGIHSAAKDLGMRVKPMFVDSVVQVDDAVPVIGKYIFGEGYPIAYLSFMVADSLESGVRSNRVIPHLVPRKKRRSTISLARLMDVRDRYIDDQAEHAYANALMRETADIMLLSLSILPAFMPDLPTADIEFKARKYYGQAAIDMEKGHGFPGLTKALSGLSDDFDKYLLVMRKYSEKSLDQHPLTEEEKAEAEEEVRKALYDETMDYFLDQINLYRSLEMHITEDRSETDMLVDDINETIDRLKKLDPEFDHPKLLGC